MTISDLLIISAASWYVSYSLTSSDGPFQVFTWIRGHIPHGRKTWVITSNEPIPTKDIRTIPGLLDCPLCLSIWIAAVFVLAPIGWLTYAFAAAGVSMWVHGYTGWKSYG